MATGTGLPVLKSGDVRTNVSGVIDGDKFSSAADWERIAKVGESIASMGADELKKTEHQAQVGYLADQETEIARKRAEFRDQFANNPDGFDAAWKGYSEGKLTEAQPWAINQIKSRLGSEGNAAFSAILGERRTKTEANAKSSWNALEDMAAGDVTGSAMAGTMTTDDGLAKIAKHRAVLETGVTSGFLVREEADRRVANLESTATVYAARTDIKTSFDRDGPSGALTRIDAITRDEKLSLSPEQRFSLGSRLRADVHAWNADREQKVSEVDLEAKSLNEARKGGVAIPQSRIDQTVDRYKALGGHAQAAQFLADQQHYDDVSWYSRAPLRDVARDVESRKARAGLSPPTENAKTALAFFQSKGLSAEDAAAFVWNFQQESGRDLNPRLSHDGGTGFGIAGFRDPTPGAGRWTNLKTFAASKGLDPADLNTQLEFAWQEMNSSEGETLARVKAAPDVGSKAAAAIGYFRPKAEFAADRARRAGDAGTLIGAPRTPTNSEVTYIGKANADVSKRVSEEANAIIEGMNRKDNPVLPTSEKMDELLTAAAATNMPDVLQKVSKAAGEWQFRRDFGRAPLATEAGYVSELERKATTTGLTPTENRQYEIAQETLDATRKALNDDPLGHAIRAGGEVASLPTPKPLDVGNPVTFADGMRLRGAWAEFGARTYQTGSMPALTADEQQQVRGAIDAADPAGKAKIYGTLVSTLPPATRSATLASLGKKGGTDMVEAFAGGMMQADPTIAESIIRGQSAMKAKDTYDPTKGDSKDVVADSLEKAMPAGTFSVADRTNPNGAYATMRSAVIARAADLAAANPNFDGKFSKEIIDRAVSDVTGGVLRHNGAPLIAPVRGMSQAQFDARVWSITDADLAGVTTQSGQPVTSEYLRSNAQFESLSDGRYLVRLGQDFERPIYAYRDNGTMGVPGGGPRMRPFVIDMRRMTPAAGPRNRDPMGMSEITGFPRG